MRQPQRGEGLVGLERGEQRQDAGGQQVARRRTGLRPGGPEAAVLRLAVLGDDQHGAAPLTAEREALDEPQGDQQDRGQHADGGEGGQQPDREGRAAHHQQRDDQQLLAADPVAEVAEDQGADRPGEEARPRRCAKAAGCRRTRRLLGEEQGREDERGGRAVEEEVVPLDRGADDARADDAAEARAGAARVRTWMCLLVEAGVVRSRTTLGVSWVAHHVGADPIGRPSCGCTPPRADG